MHRIRKKSDDCCGLFNVRIHVITADSKKTIKLTKFMHGYGNSVNFFVVVVVIRMN